MKHRTGFKMEISEEQYEILERKTNPFLRDERRDEISITLNLEVERIENVSIQKFTCNGVSRYYLFLSLEDEN